MTNGFDERAWRGCFRKLQQRDRFPLIALQSMRDVRAYLDGVEAEAFSTALAAGARVDDIAEALGVTRQAIYYRLKAQQKPTPRTSRASQA